MAGTAVREQRLLRVVLFGIALHSLLTGLGLLLQPAALFAWAGWNSVTEPFFPAQGGVFHILMAALYVLAALRSDRETALLPFVVFVKSAAAVFLLSYCVLAGPVWVVLVSGILDAVMAAVVGILWLHIRGRRQARPRIPRA